MKGRWIDVVAAFDKLRLRSFLNAINNFSSS
jgi:hypothetical protein